MLVYRARVFRGLLVNLGGSKGFFDHSRSDADNQEQLLRKVAGLLRARRAT
jgi:hypothetical protein